MGAPRTDASGTDALSPSAFRTAGSRADASPAGASRADVPPSGTFHTAFSRAVAPRTPASRTDAPSAGASRADASPAGAFRTGVSRPDGGVAPSRTPSATESTERTTQADAGEGRSGGKIGAPSPGTVDADTDAPPLRAGDADASEDLPGADAGTSFEGVDPDSSDTDTGPDNVVVLDPEADSESSSNSGSGPDSESSSGFDFYLDSSSDAEVDSGSESSSASEADLSSGADSDFSSEADSGSEAAVEDSDRIDDETDGAAEGDEEAEETEGDRVREIPLPDVVSEALTNALTALRNGVTDLRFNLDLPGAEEARRTQSEILAQLDDYVIPRVHMSTAPALVVIAGSTGAGKSTLINTLANAKVSATGVRRPTTGTPVLACHPDDHEWFAKGDLLGSLRRQSESDSDTAPGGLVLVSTERLPPGVALLDTPDIDSVVEEHHEIAHRMLDAADLWIFVTTAARYADAPAWRLLRLAKERGARLAIVLSRVSPQSREVVTKHFVRMLTEYGLGEVDRFVINESKATDGMLPDHEVTELRLWLTELSVDDRRRAQAVQATLFGALNSFRTRIPALAKQLEAQVSFRSDLRTDVDAAYINAMTEIEEATRNGSLLRGEVLARWQDFAGSGDLMRTLHLRKPGRFAGKATQQAPERLSALKSALRAGLESVVVSAAQRAAEETAARWLHRQSTGKILVATPGLGRASDELLRKTSRVIGAWQDHIIELIRTEGVTKRSVARVISFDVESLALILTVGLLGNGSAEAGGIAGALPQRLVHALLGAESLRNIGVKARSDLRARIGMLFDDETSRYVQVLDGAGIPDENAATRLYQATYNLEVAR
ncbi:dynamin family protein [Streptosporangium subroseum]|uniref:dynamin family protein n=1 Tax=Streptosporangium subroseum TaxID=106412 RepID=UPI003413EDF2